MTHDHYCPSSDGGMFCCCELIARVREDERDNCWGAVDELVPSELWNGATTEWWIVKADALAAIEALGGER